MLKNQSKRSASFTKHIVSLNNFLLVSAGKSLEAHNKIAVKSNLRELIKLCGPRKTPSKKASPLSIKRGRTVKNFSSFSKPPFDAHITFSTSLKLNMNKRGFSLQR